MGATMRFTLRTLMLVVAAVAVLLGIFRQYSWLGLVLFVEGVLQIPILGVFVTNWVADSWKFSLPHRWQCQMPRWHTYLIVGIIVALDVMVFVAVQRATEAARRAQCKPGTRQIGLAPPDGRRTP